MKRHAALVLTLAGLYACVPGSKEEVNNQSTKVTMVGSFRSNGGSTDIYFGKSDSPIATTTEQGSFKIEIPRELIESTDDRRLYFYSSLREEGVSAEITEFESGTKSLGTVQLRPVLEVEGIVSASDKGTLVPVSGAEVRIGRIKATTDANGRYTASLPQQTKLIVEVEKAGFVITKSRWFTADVNEVRPFRLYKNLEPQGFLSMPTQERRLKDDDSAVVINVDSTPGTEWVRISSAPFSVEAELDSSWQSLSKAITVPNSDLSSSELYYQFADGEKRILSPVQVMSITPVGP